MNRFSEYVSLGFRLSSGGNLLALSVGLIGLDIIPMHFHNEMFHAFQKVNFLNAAFAALLAMCGIWLAFGIRTRVISTLSLFLLLGLSILNSHGVGFLAHCLEQNCYLITWTLFTFIMLLSLVALGGGKFAAYSRGWSDISL